MHTHVFIVVCECLSWCVPVLFVYMCVVCVCLLLMCVLGTRDDVRPSNDRNIIIMEIDYEGQKQRFARVQQ